MQSEKVLWSRQSGVLEDKIKNVQETLGYLSEPFPSPSCLHSSHMNITQTCQTHFCLRAFVLAVSSARSCRLSDLHVAAFFSSFGPQHTCHHLREAFPRRLS